MDASIALSRPGIRPDQPKRFGNFATNLQVDRETDATTLFTAFQNWSKFAYAKNSSHAKLWRVTEKDCASSVTDDADDEIEYIKPLMSFLIIDEHIRFDNKDILYAAARSGVKPLLVVSELFKCSEQRPETYTLKTGEITLDYQFEGARVSCVFDDEYCHVMSSVGGNIEDEYFEGSAYSINSVRDYLIKQLDKLKK